MRIEKLQQNYNIKVEYVNFPLHPDTPMEGVALSKLFGPADLGRIQASRMQLKALADAEGLPMSDRTMTYNSRLAQELGCWATEKGKGPEFHKAAFRAYFVDGRNIADTGVLADLAKSVGLDPVEARKVVEQRLYKDQVDRQWAECQAAGVNAVPTFEAGGQQVVGAQPYETLAHLVELAGAKKLSSSAP